MTLDDDVQEVIGDGIRIREEGLTRVEREHPELFDWKNPSDFCVLLGYATQSEPIVPTTNFVAVRANLTDKGYLGAAPAISLIGDSPTSYKVTEKGIEYMKKLASELKVTL